MGLEQARRGIEDAIRIFLGSTLSAAWNLAPGILTCAENVAIWVDHENCARPSEAVEALENAIARAISKATGETWKVRAWHEARQTQVTIRRSKLAMALDHLRNGRQMLREEADFQSGYSTPPRCGKVRNAAEAWRESAMARLAELDGTPEANAPHTFFTKRLNMDEPRLIIRDELTDWTREQRQKKTEERKMFEVNEIVAITEETKAIKLVVHKEETEKELAMTAQVAAQYQRATVRKVDVSGDVLVLHVGSRGC